MASPDDRVDLHAHTCVSDGTLTPTQLVERAAATGLAAIAVTDHDHVGGVKEAREAGARLGVEIVAGIEFSAVHPLGSLHLLGYFVDVDDGPFLARLDRLRAERHARARRMATRLQDAGVDVTLADIAAEVTGGEQASIGRPHVARALMRKGFVRDVVDAFDRYLGPGRPGYVPREPLAARDAIRIVHDAAGVASLAHPSTLAPHARETIVRDLARVGLDAVEVVHPKNDEALRAALLSWADELGLGTSGGSDYHGDNKPDIALGSGCDGNVLVTRATLDALAARCARPRRA